MSAIGDRLSGLFDPLADRARGAVAPLREKAEAWFDTLQPRERIIVAVGTVFVVIALVYGALWLPLAHARATAEQRLQDARALAVQLERAGASAHAHPGAHPPGGGDSLLTVVDQASRTPELGKAPTRLQPDGDSSVRVWFENVPFDNLVRWMGTLEARYGLQVTAVDVERQDAPGTVNARLSVGRGS